MSLSHKSPPVSSGTAARSSRPEFLSRLNNASASCPLEVHSLPSYLATNPDYILPLTLCRAFCLLLSSRPCTPRRCPSPRSPQDRVNQFSITGGRAKEHRKGEEVASDRTEGGRFRRSGRRGRQTRIIIYLAATVIFINQRIYGGE